MSNATKKRTAVSNGEDFSKKNASGQKIQMPKERYGFEDLKPLIETLSIGTSGKIFEFFHDSDQKNLTYKGFPMMFKNVRTDGGLQYHEKPENGEEAMFVRMDITEEQYNWLNGPFLNKIIDVLHASPETYFNAATVKIFKNKSNTEAQKQYLLEQWIPTFVDESTNKDGTRTFPRNLKLKARMDKATKMPDMDIFDKDNTYKYWFPSTFYAPKPDQKVDPAKQAKEKEEYQNKVEEWKQKFTTPRQVADMIGPDSFNDYRYDFVGISVIGGKQWAISGYLRQIRRIVVKERKAYNAVKPGDKRRCDFGEDIPDASQPTIPVVASEEEVEEEEYEEVEEEVEEDEEA